MPDVLYPVAVEGIGTSMVAMEVLDPGRAPYGFVLGTAIEIRDAALSLGVPVVLGLTAASDETVSALVAPMGETSSVLLWANLPTRDDFVRQLMALPGLAPVIYVHAGPRAVLTFGHKAVTETGPDGKVIGILAYYERPGQTPQLSVGVEPEHRRQGVATRLMAKASEEWGVDVLALVAKLAETEPESFSDDGRALWESVVTRAQADPGD